MSFWAGKNVLVTGGGGFIGSHLVERLLRVGARVRVVGRSKNPTNLTHIRSHIEYLQGDLSQLDHCARVVKGMEVVFHLASKVAGIGYNVSHHAEMFATNCVLNLNMLLVATQENVERYQCTSSTCVYSRQCTVPTPEVEGFLGDPEPTVLGYGWAKRVAEIQARLVAKDFGMKIAIIRPSNAYGPRGDFSLNTSHVIPALIRRVYQCKKTIIVWGSGNQTRSFTYVDDVARGMMEVTEKYAIADPINIGTDEEVTIKQLADTILRLTGRKRRLRFDLEKPEGQPRKFADITKAKEKIGWKAEFDLEEGLKRTINWYKKNIRSS